MATRLFVGNLPDNTQEEDLQAAFSKYGEIKDLDLKSKSAVDNESKRFAFVTISASNSNIESCIQHFSTDDYKGKRLYVTRARESFLERLQRERAEAQQKLLEKGEPQPHHHKKHPVIKLGDKLNPRKRKLSNEANVKQISPKHTKTSHNYTQINNEIEIKFQNGVLGEDKKKSDSEKKRMEAMKKKRQEFKEKQMIVKSGLNNVDIVKNKKVIFSDFEMESTPEEEKTSEAKTKPNKSKLFDDNEEASDDDFNFEIKKQYEGKKGQKVLDLQSRYKSDKRFVLDERFINDENSEGEDNEEQNQANGETEINNTDEKAKQLNILQEVLGVTIKRKRSDEEKEKKTKHKIGMLRFDPTQPDHAKFLAPVEDTKQQSTKKSKKKKDKVSEEPQEQESKPEEPRPEVSKEQFYKISDTLKEAITQPTSFSLRSLFGTKDNEEKDIIKELQEERPIPLQKKTKLRNPLDPGEKNPFVYDSSDTETEEPEKEVKEPAPVAKVVWHESLFFEPDDPRLKEGLEFFNYNSETEEPHTDRRELKALMKKRIYNMNRKNQIFQKKIGGKKKLMKKTYRRKT